MSDPGHSVSKSFSGLEGLFRPKGVVRGDVTIPESEKIIIGQMGVRRRIQGPEIPLTPQTTEKPLVFVHGFASSIFSWKDLQPVLAEQFHTHSLDLPGMGYSDKPSSDLSLDFFGDFLERYLDHHQIDQCDLVAHSLGSAISFVFALKRPERVRRLVLLAPLINFARVQEGFLGKGLKAVSTPGLAQAIIFFYGRWFNKLFLKQVTAEKSILNADFINSYHQPLTHPQANASLYQVYRLLANPKNRKLVERIPEISHPVLTLWGEKDPLIKKADAILFDHADKPFTSEILMGCGHMVMHERHEEVSKHVIQFLTS